MDEFSAEPTSSQQRDWQKTLFATKIAKLFGDVHEYVLVYAKDRRALMERELLSANGRATSKIYKNPNNDPEGRGGYSNDSASGHRPKQHESDT